MFDVIIFFYVVSMIGRFIYDFLKFCIFDFKNTFLYIFKLDDVFNAILIINCIRMIRMSLETKISVFFHCLKLYFYMKKDIPYTTLTSSLTVRGKKIILLYKQEKVIFSILGKKITLINIKFYSKHEESVIKNAILDKCDQSIKETVSFKYEF